MRLPEAQDMSPCGNVTGVLSGIDAKAKGRLTPGMRRDRQQLCHGFFMEKSLRFTEQAANQEEVPWRRAHRKLWRTGYHGDQGGSEKDSSLGSHFWSKRRCLSPVP